MGIFRRPVENVFNRPGFYPVGDICSEFDSVRLRKSEEMSYGQSCPEFPVISIRHHIGAVASGHVQTDLHRLRMQEIITVKEKHVFPFSQSDSIVPCLRHSGIPFVDDPESGIAPGIGIEYPGRGIPAPVIHAYRLPVPESLADQTVQTSRKHFPDIIDRYDY